jgi:hypothetical protein
LPLKSSLQKFLTAYFDGLFPKKIFKTALPVPNLAGFFKKFFDGLFDGLKKRLNLGVYRGFGIVKNLLTSFEDSDIVFAVKKRCNLKVCELRFLLK